MSYAILALVLIASDQLVKYLTVQNIPLGESIPFIAHIMELTYVQNTGAAFSLFADHTWLLTITSLVMSVMLAYFIFVKPYFKHIWGRTSLTLIFAGAVGNLIDRAALQFVVDMFDLTFINFAVFNVADVCVCVGGFFLCIYYLFYYEKLEGPVIDHTDTHC